MLFRALRERLTRRADSPAPQARPSSGGRALGVEALEDRSMPSASFSIGDVTVVKGNTGTLSALVPVTLRGSHGNNVTVEYKIADGTAAAGSDYAAVSGKLTFSKNDTTKSIIVPIRGDRLVETSEIFSVLLSNAKAANILDGAGIVNIVDNEPRVRVDDPTVWEGNSGTAVMNFTVTLQAAYATGGGTTAGADYAASGTVAFQPGQASQTIAVEVAGDRMLESDETVQINLTTADTSVALTRSVGVGTILDNEPHLSVTIAFQDYYGTSLTFYLTLRVAYDEGVAVDFGTFDGSAVADVDYVGTSGTLTFVPADTTQSFTVQLLSIEPADKFLYASIGNPSSNAWVDSSWVYGIWYYEYGGW